MVSEEYIPRDIGPYRIVKRIGLGGMGIVYKAVHKRSGRIAALKTVRIPNRLFLQSIRREIHTLARLSHPGIVRIISEGVDRGVPWYAMEWLEGITLRDYFNRLVHKTGHTNDNQTTGDVSPTIIREKTSAINWTNVVDRRKTTVSRLDTEVRKMTLMKWSSFKSDQKPDFRSKELAGFGRLHEFLSLVGRVCSTLSYLHGEGIVHRDLKPENILIKANGMPILIDFGIVTQFSSGSRDVIESISNAFGTISYVAPEQIRGEMVDARADLYALGCILYELVTGRTPFSGQTSLIINHHLNVAPLRPAELVKEVPPELEELIANLLMKDAHDRCGYADVVIRELKNLGAVVEQNGVTVKSRPYLYRPQFSGRKDLVDILRTRLNALFSRRGSMVLLGGESGIGKTRLAIEMGRKAENRDIQVLSGSCVDVGSRVMEVFRKPLLAIADYCREAGLDETERIFGPYGKILAPFEQSLRSLPGQERYPEPVEVSPEIAIIRYFEASARVMVSFAEEKPLFLVLDDLQWADDFSIRFLMFLIEQKTIESAPIFVLGTYRTEEVHDLLEKLLTLGGVSLHSINRLNEWEVTQILKDMLALPTVHPSFGHYITKHADGNPFFVSEYIRLAVSEGILIRQEGGKWQIGKSDVEVTDALFEELPLPGSLQHLVKRRLSALTEDAMRTARVAAIIGRVSSIPLLKKATGFHDRQFFEALAILYRKQVFEDISADTLQFTHDQIRHVTERSISATEKRQFHGLVAEGIEGLFRDSLESFAAILGYHWEKAGNSDKAYQWYSQAGDNALSSFTFDEAARYLEAALRLASLPTPDNVDLRNKLGYQVYCQMGRLDEAALLHTEALELSRQLNERIKESRSLRHLGWIHAQKGDLDQAKELYKSAALIARTENNKILESHLLNDLAGLAKLQGQIDESEKLLEKAMDYLDVLDVSSMQGTIWGNMAILKDNSGDLENALILFNKAIEAARDEGDKRNEGLWLGNLAGIYYKQGNFEKAQNLCEQALAMHRDIGDKSLETLWLSNLAILYSEQEKYEQAKLLYLRALDLARLMSRKLDEGRTLGNLASLYRDTGDIEKAKSLYHQALDIMKAIGEIKEQGIWLSHLGSIKRWTAKSPEEADIFYEESERLLIESDSKFYLGILLCAMGHQAIACDRDPKTFLQRVKKIAAEIGAGPQSELGKEIALLASAIEIHAAGEDFKLHRGELVQEIPEAVLRYYQDHIA